MSVLVYFDTAMARPLVGLSLAGLHRAALRDRQGMWGQAAIRTLRSGAYDTSPAIQKSPILSFTAAQPS